MAAHPELAHAPEAAPARHANDLAKVETDLKLIFNASRVPYYQASIAADGYTSVVDLADRWATLADVRNKAAEDYEFRDTEHNYDAKSSLRTATRLQQAVEIAVQYKQSTTRTPLAPTKIKEWGTSRQANDQSWKQRKHLRPRPNKQLGDSTRGPR
jgi:hypothetical protein